MQTEHRCGHIDTCILQAYRHTAQQQQQDMSVLKPSNSNRARRTVSRAAGPTALCQKKCSLVVVVLQGCSLGSHHKQRVPVGKVQLWCCAVVLLCVDFDRKTVAERYDSG
jgi:hypothetical protein